MRLAILSDIHGNADALAQVFKDINRSEVERIVCLGDIIGYGPEPNRVISMIRERDVSTIMGNHELAVVDPEQLQSFNRYARQSQIKTMSMLSDDEFNYIRSLPPVLVIDDCRLVHAFPPDSCLTYLSFVSANELKDAFREMTETICFLGHTHLLEIVGYDGHLIDRSPLFKGITELKPKVRYICNVGSVGQPRDGNRQAKYIIWDTKMLTIDVRYVTYDNQAVADKIIKAGFPEIHARMLQ